MATKKKSDVKRAYDDGYIVGMSINRGDNSGANFAVGMFRSLLTYSKTPKEKLIKAYQRGQATALKKSLKSKNPALALPRNKWLNAKVQVTSSGKILAQIASPLLATKKNSRKRKRR